MSHKEKIGEFTYHTMPPVEYGRYGGYSIGDFYTGHGGINFLNKNIKFAFTVEKDVPYHEDRTFVHSFKKGVDVLDFRNFNDVSCDDISIHERYYSGSYNHAIKVEGKDFSIAITTSADVESFTCDDFLFANSAEDASVLADSVNVESFEVA